jgi:hypothetical protein
VIVVSISSIPSSLSKWPAYITLLA